MKAIYIDAGHGLGEDGSNDNGGSAIVQERERVVQIAKLTVSLLRAQPKLAGVAIVPIGVEERLMLIDHIKVANMDYLQNNYREGDALLVSIHCNAGGGSGSESWYESGNEDSKMLAVKVGSICASHSGLAYRGTKGDLDNRRGRLGIVRDVKATAALVECGFVDSAIDAPRLRDTPERFASGIVDGIVTHLGIQFVKPALVFPDVEAGRWSEEAIKYCKEKGFMKGSEDGLFHPTDALTREQMATILFRLKP